MKKSISIFAAFAACLISISCQKEDDPVVEGQYTEFQLSITTPAPTDVTVTKATDQQETQVDNLMLLFYKDKRYSSPLVVKINNLGTPQKVAGSETNYIYTVTIKSEDSGADTPLTSGDWYLFAVANYNRLGFGNINIDEFQTLPLEKAQDWYVSRINPGAADLNMNEAALLMTGFYGRTDGKVTLRQKTSPTDNTVQKLDERVHLRRITSKISLNFKTGSNDVKFTPSSYSIYNYPILSQTFENQGWTKRDGAVDNVSGTFPGASVRNIVAYDSQVRNILNMPFNGSATFYMYENVQRPASTDCDTYVKRELRYAGDYGQFVHAPQFSTYVVVKGYYEGPISSDNSQKVTGDVTYTIHLGDFSTATGSNDNFTVRRNSKYNYNVTINGVNSIYVEATTNAENQPGAEGNLIAQPITTDLEVDAHYDTKMIKIPVSFIHNASENFDYNLSIITNTPKDNHVAVDLAAGATANPGSQDFNWIHFIKPTNKTTFRSYPGDGSNLMTDIYGLVQDLRDGTEQFSLKTSDEGGMFYVEAFIDEYVYDDLRLDQYVNAPNREITLQHGASVSHDGQSSYIDKGAMSIRQRSMRTMYDLSNSSASYHPFAIEVFEEQSGPLPISGINQTDNTQKGDSMSDGYANSVSMFTTAGGSNPQWATYINTADWTLVRASISSSTSLTYDTQFRDGRMACLTRNRDANGNGIIDAEEVVWYLPARDQAVAIMLGHKALGNDYLTTEIDTNPAQPHEARWYWTSSRGNAQMFNPLERQTSFSQHWAPIGRSTSSSEKNYSYRFGTASVRCVRTLNSVSAVPDPVIAYDSANSTITVSNLNSVCVRGPISGEYILHYQDEATNTMPAAFKVAANELVVDTKEKFSTNEMKTQRLCQDNYSENPDGSDLGLWRIPNQSELYSMILTMPSSVFYVAGDSEPIRRLAARTTMRLPYGVNTAIGYHWEAVFYATRNETFGVYQASGSNSLKDVGIDGPYFRVRCVRDADVTGNNINAAAAGHDAGWTNAEAGSEPVGGSRF